MRVLALVAPGDLMVNTPIEFILAGSTVTLDFLYVLPGRQLPQEIPDHDIAFVAVSEPDQNAALLRRLCRITAAWPRPVVNDPSRILMLSREHVYSLLRDLPGVAMPQTLRTSHRDLREAARRESTFGGADESFTYPVIVRPIGSHAGAKLRKIEDAAALSAYLDGSTSSDFYLMPFVDYRRRDGLYRKYRIVFIQGRPYLCHMAVSEHWMIHYLNAGMSESEAKRAEEADAMATFDDHFAPKHTRAFRGLCERFGLDYFGIDCSETSDGRLLVFEVDVAMVIHDMDPPEIFPYKRPQMKRIFDAFTHMLESVSQRT